MSRARATGSLAAALLLAGAAFDSTSLYVPAVGLFLLIAAAVAWVRLARRGASVERLPGAWSVIEGAPYRLAIEVRRARVLGGTPRVIDPLLEKPLEVGPEPEAVLGVETSFPRRGRHPLPVVALELGDPFGLRSARVRAAEGSTVLVLPRVEAVFPGGGDSRRRGRASHGGARPRTCPGRAVR